MNKRNNYKQMYMTQKKKKKIRNFAAILKKLSVSIFETGFSFVSALHIENCKLVIADCGMIE